MHQDFKQDYINEQKRLQAERRARLAKIGVGTPPPSKEENTADRVGEVHRVQRAPQDRQQTVPNASGNGARRPAPSGQTRRPPMQGQRPVNRATQNQDARMQAPSRPSQADSVRRSTAQQDPKARPVQQGRPVRNTGVAGQGPADMRRINQPRPRKTDDFDLSEEDIFKKSLSEDESRAMMFSLTGTAKKPDDGGSVDLVDLGFRRSKAKRNASYISSSSKKGSAGRYIGRAAVCLGTLILMVIVTVYSLLLVIAYGPSESARDLAVNSAMQASATKWVPYLVLSKSKVNEILSKSEDVVQDVVSIDDYNTDVSDSDEDEWENAVDGMIFDTVKASTFKAYVLLVKDPSRVFVGTSTDDFSNATAGVNVFQAAERYNAVACINAGEFLDNGGHGSGYAPLGLTYSAGKCVFDDKSTKTFMGFTADNNLIVRESMTQKEADALGIRDAVSFQTGNTLIERDGDDIKFYYADGNTGTSQRTAIGQRADGTVIMIVTDGRTASSLGATHNDMIDLMVSYGAVSAGMLDGGSSAMMYYRDYYDKYDIDKSSLDEYQLQGLVNNYKAFTSPRRIPTFFMVKPES